MEKKAQRKTYKDPVLNKIIQEKAAWNKQVSALINDLIHFKKSVNGWPSKYYKERTRITQPVPVDLSGILSQLSGDFQEIANRGNSILSEQSEFSKSHLKRKSDQTLSKLEQLRGPENAPAAPPTAGAPNLTQELGKGLASDRSDKLIKLASELEDKYSLEALASNPFSRFITRLFNPKFGFGEAARVRRLRMTMLDNCVKSFKALKQLHAEVVKSSKGSIVSSHKMMTAVWNYWNIVNRLFSAYKALKPGDVKDPGGQIEDPELKKQRAIEEGRDPDVEQEQQQPIGQMGTALAATFLTQLQDYRTAAPKLNVTSPAFRELGSITEAVMAAPKNKKVEVLLSYKLEEIYHKAIEEVRKELNTTGSTFQEIVNNIQLGANKTAQEFRGFLGKTRHQLLPGATSGSRLEVYNLITQLKEDLDNVMNLLESGFDQQKLAPAVTQVNRQMAALRTMIRSLYFSEKPEEASSPFF